MKDLDYFHQELIAIDALKSLADTYRNNHYHHAADSALAHADLIRARAVIRTSVKQEKRGQQDA